MVMKSRCDWATDKEQYIKYHDEEWGVPLHDDQLLFEFLTLEAFQAGLSWYLILSKRQNFRKAFANFNYAKVAEFDEKDFERLVSDTGIVRNRLKISAAINNAQKFIEVRKEFGSFDKYIWGFVDGEPIQNNFKQMSDPPSKTELSDKVSKDLKARGFKFVGSTVVYSHMQATGMVNDHVTSCFRHDVVTSRLQ